MGAVDAALAAMLSGAGSMGATGANLGASGQLGSPWTTEDMLSRLAPNERAAAQFHLADRDRMADAGKSADAALAEVLRGQDAAAGRWRSSDYGQQGMGPRALYYAGRAAPPGPLPEPIVRRSNLSRQAQDALDSYRQRQQAAMSQLGIGDLFRTRSFTPEEQASGQARRDVAASDAEMRRRWVSNNAAARQGLARPYKSGAETSAEDYAYARLNQAGDADRSRERMGLNAALLQMLRDDRAGDRQAQALDRAGANQLAIARLNAESADKRDAASFDRQLALLRHQSASSPPAWQLAELNRVGDQADRAMAALRDPANQNLPPDQRKQLIDIANHLQQKHAAMSQRLAAMSDPNARQPGALGSAVGSVIGQSGGASDPYQPMPVPEITSPRAAEGQDDYAQAAAIMARPDSTADEVFGGMRSMDLSPKVIVAAIQKYGRPAVEKAIIQNSVRQSNPMSAGGWMASGPISQYVMPWIAYQMNPRDADKTIADAYRFAGP